MCGALFTPLALPQAPWTAGMVSMSPSLQSRAMSDLPVKKDANSCLGPQQHCSVAAALRHCSIQSEPREFCLCDFLQLIF